jgi:hypothetical protein
MQANTATLLPCRLEHDVVGYAWGTAGAWEGASTGAAAVSIQHVLVDSHVVPSKVVLPTIT